MITLQHLLSIKKKMENLLELLLLKHYKGKKCKLV